ncbi:hypothetical protein ES689_12155 [Frigoribacterium sp. ACAM 257]|uniref:hypothetical protein n=1 Tax=Frigoribacterium sp. ACAM 257 TaxID=2508998 RepID=UPI0011BA3D88|nr:hypothetical protein [Frigoribacterium sp. ACAM 257]TWX37387.1 hypothetical protein ES689_12155 [Frigoribacterium sp. ACAM 257]
MAELTSPSTGPSLPPSLPPRFRSVFSGSAWLTPPTGWFKVEPEAERAWLLVPGTPVIVDAEWNIDRDLFDYTQSSGFLALAPSAAETYAREIVMWCNNLLENDVSWLEAQRAHVIAFEMKRRGRDGMARPISGATWSKFGAAMSPLYAWARGHSLVEYAPLDGSQSMGRFGGRVSRSSDSVHDRDRWVTPSALRLYRDVAFLGRTPVLRDGVWRAGKENYTRSRTDERNAAYLLLTYSTALRRQEVGTLLISELPDLEGDEASLARAVAKFGKQRAWSSLSGGLGATWDYINTMRNAHVKRARARNAYADLSEAIWIVGKRLLSKGKIALIDSAGVEHELQEIDAGKRSRLFTTLRDGLPEPMAVWLTEGGFPLDHRTWDRIFSDANARFARAMGLAGYEGSPIYLSPQSLRFSAALALLLALLRARDQRDGRRAMSHDMSVYAQCFTIVQELLGHASRETTENTYVDPVRNFGSDLSLEHAVEFAEALTNLAQRDARVRDHLTEVQ